MATQQDVIKKFMASLDKTTLSGTAALDEAIKACSNFGSMQEVIDKMISDCESVGNGKNFLLDYCGINLDNDDTGAITGFDAGGSAVKNAEDIVPETGELIKFTGNSFTVKGLTLQLEDNFNTLTDSQKFIWQGLYTWWAKGALELIAESYGNNFGFDSNSSATTKTMYVNFNENRRNTLASMWYGYYLNLKVNNSYYGYYLDTVDPNGVNTLPSGFYMPGITEVQYLDRTLIHEFTHAVMMTNINNYSSLPQFIREGMPELTHGIDDERKSSILNLAGDSESLKSALNFEASQADEGSYSGGYMFLRYLAKQAADEDNVIANIDAAVILNGTSLNDNIFNSGDSVSIYSGAGNDIVENYSKRLYIDLGAGNDYVYNDYNSNGNCNYAVIYGGAGNDYIYSKGFYGTIEGGIGNDTIKGIGRRENEVYGGEGNDTISGSGSTIYGGDGDDSLQSYKGSINTIDGGSGNDTILGFDFASLIGGAGNDVITLKLASYEGTATVSGDLGNDSITYSKFASAELAAMYYGKTGKNRYLAIYQYANGDGADVINVFTKYDKIEISGGNYSSVISGNDIILKIGSGSITLKDAKDIEELNIEGTFDSTSGGNTDTVKTIHNTKSDTLISGGNGNDTIISVQYDGAQVLYRNTIHGGNGNDKIRVYLSSLNAVYGDDGNDSIYADFNDDITIYGGNGNDTLVIEGANRPVVNGGRGNDLVTLRASNSLYQYASGDGNDTIYGLDSNDIVKISGGKYSTVKSGADLKVSVGGGAILLKGAANSAVKFDGTLEGGGSSNETLPAGISIKNSVLTASTKFTGNEINLADYPTATKLNASALSQAVSIVGTSANNSLKGGKGADTISGGSGNDTLAGGAGKDIFIYSSGNDLITDYKTGEDKISANYTSSSVKGSDVILTTSNGNLTVKGAKDKVVTFIDGSEKIFYADTSYAPLATGLSYDAKRTVLTASNKFTGTEINLANYLLTATKFNGANAKNALEITGNATNNSLKGGKSADTISGGSGNDTLAGGAGKDIFIYSSGNDLITDYKAGEDKISANYTSSSVKGSDVILTTSNGNLTVKGAKDKVVTFIDGNEKIFYADTSYAPLETGLTYDAKRTVLTASNKFAGTEINLANYLLTATKFNGANAKNALEITGNATNNSLKGGKGADTISGGSGNDTLAGGAGKDIFIYSSGNDLITDYSTEDKIKINGKISGTSYSGKNVIFTVGDGSLTVKNGKGKNISVTDSSGAQTYSKTFDLLEDNNFISDVPQISDISEKKFAVTQIQEIKVEELSQPILTFSKEK